MNKNNLKDLNDTLKMGNKLLNTYVGDVPHKFNKDGSRNKNVKTHEDFYKTKSGFIIVHERQDGSSPLDDRNKNYGMYGKGIWFDLENGYKVSIQFGKTNYCSNYTNRIGENELPFDYVLKTTEDSTEDERFTTSVTAEVLVMKPNGKWLEPYKKDGEARYNQNYNNVSDVIEILNYANSLEPNNYGRVAKK